MSKRIVIIQGHPDPNPERYCHALAQAYAEGARTAGHEVRMIEVGKLGFPILRSKEEWERQALPESLRESQEALIWAQHWVLIFPLWLGAMPALLKGLLEQVLRPEIVAEGDDKSGKPWRKLLTGRSARIVVTMGMPAWVYRWIYFAHGLKSLERNVLAFGGIGPIRETLIGSVEAIDQDAREKWCANLRELGRRAR